MGQKSGSRDGAAAIAPHENPLVPNRTMKSMYEGIVQSRLLDDLLQKRARKAKLPSGHGQEACRISALIGLDAEDLTSDVAGSIHTAFLRGIDLERIVAHVDALASGKKKQIAAARLSLSGLLPDIADTEERVQLALGAALTLKRLRLAKVVIVFASGRDLKHSAWRRVLRFATREELPVLFVVLPERASKHPDKSHAPFKLCALAAAVGVPGIPVDASDAVALYRVAQESIGRGRIGGGPSLMECLHVAHANDSKKSDRKHDPEKTDHDPHAAMAQALLNRQICNQPWLDDVAAAFQARLRAL